MAEIKYVGLKELDDFETDELKKISEAEFEKLMKKTRLKEAELTIAVKKIHNADKGHHYELVFKLNAAGTKKAWFDVRHDDFDLAKVAHRCFEALNSHMQKVMSK
ncbi:MAG: hypothetical protein AABX27_00140 [Nanoarchaeota archaeon]